MKNINKIKNDIEKFIERVDVPYQNYLLNNQEKYSKSIYSLEYFYFVTNYISTMKFSSVDDELVLLGLFTKASMDLYGIHYCLKHGLETQAQQIARGLYETYITVELILKEDVNARLKLFHDFHHIQRWNHVDFNMKINSEYDLNGFYSNPEYLKKLNENFEEVKNNYHPKSPTHWAWKIFKDKVKNRNPSMLDICRYLGDFYLNEYAMTYPTASLSSHPNQVVADYFKKSDKERNVIVNAPNYTNLTINISGISLGYCSKITNNILNYFKITDYKNIIEFINYFVAEAVEIE